MAAIPAYRAVSVLLPRSSRLMSFPVTRTTSPKQRPHDDDLRFGRTFSDHMFIMNYDEGQGWHDPRIVPYAPFTFDPACCVLHYAQSVFDGLKAFRGADGAVRIFRPSRHAERLNQSCEKLCIPQLDPALIEESIAALVQVDQDWVPSKAGTSLYIRPTVIASETFLGVHPSHSYIYFVILSPVGAYYAEGLNPVKILATDTHVRAVQGGLGAAKTAGNYAASLQAARDAQAEGYTQVLWLDGVHREYLDEVGTMNIMLRIGNEVITPPLSSGTILAGITRDSVLTLMREWGMTVNERPISIHEVMAAAERGDLAEMWGTGTAAVISPIGELGYRGQKIIINRGKIGDLTQRLYDTIIGIQYGTVADAHGWTRIVVKEPASAAA
ncbi:Branched-chain amino acid aminotransferase [Granulibacter bethesdensis]|uniref:Probable branched-chain-amino-acid aminotransferase n=2 Tax=Granulibacter bethesdensis TaxID=364410 RepID=A0AAN0RCV2_9PROT|nr:Branched-chain amino acid aminotransferase [Granulibacter bethesdensis]AHJ66877.1 Branched-chain amino acid aminotransferase [Granulibacter bethesdensis CGDNIH4]APH59065.1 Branched-chain amino acid aminotransferase [Granulibacter bethesdensis]